MPGVYISYPFCNQKCSFCNFASDVSSREIRTQYARILLKEVRAHGWDWLPETVYLGGGTPSLMPPDLIRDVMSAIPQTRLGEVTIECAPGTLTPSMVETWMQCGFNRVSLGVQSFVEAELRQVGRRHTASAIAVEIDLLKRIGIRNINVDLIAGLPGQTRQSWEYSLDWLERLEIPHASVYIFEIDEDSRLGREVLVGGMQYGAQSVPGDEITVELYERAVERLSRMGLGRYEISNFARPGTESRHNLKYWQLEPYVGFGLDAHSFDGANRWSNPDRLDEYFAQQDKRAGLSRKLIATDSSEEIFFVGLRLMRGIEPTVQEWCRFGKAIERHLKSGMLERDGERLRLSASGVLLSNEIFQEFIDA